jgi:hypothetical protein
MAAAVRPKPESGNIHTLQDLHRPPSSSSFQSRAYYRRLKLLQEAMDSLATEQAASQEGIERLAERLDIADYRASELSLKIARLVKETERTRAIALSATGAMAGLLLGCCKRATRKDLLIRAVGGALAGMATAKLCSYLKKVEEESF